MNDATMSDAKHWRSGKGHRDENFPVASLLIHPRHREVILAFYNFVRTADDIADHATLAPAGEACACSTASKPASSATATTMRPPCELRAALAERALSPRHAQDLLAAFKLDVTKLRYRDWDDLIHYCALFGDAGRPLRARRARREPQHLAGQRRAMRGVADHQSSAGLQGRLPQSRPRLYSARRARRARRRRRSARRAARLAGAARRAAQPRRTHRAIARARAMSSRS